MDSPDQSDDLASASGAQRQHDRRSLHYTLQIAFGWSDTHLNLFHIHDQDYDVSHDGGISFSSNADQVRLCDFKFRNNERCIYEYDLGDCWQHEVRVEARLAPEDCGGFLAILARRDAVPLQVADLFEDIREYLETNDLAAIRLLTEDVQDLREWLTLDSFDRRAINRRLRQYATNDEAWMRH